MPYGCYFAGVSLPLSTAQHQSWLNAVHPQTGPTWSAWNFEGFTLGQLPTPAWPQQPDLRCGVLIWPTGAVRPAFFTFVCNTSKLDQIRAAVGNPGTPKSLVMDDGRSGKTITASMYLLACRPLNQLGTDASDAWAVILTDQRFFWHWRRGVITQPSSWSNLYAQIASILGVAITPEAVNAAYGTPSSKWVQYYQPTGTILDSAATQVGQRVVVQLDGTVTTVGWQAAKAASDGQLGSLTLISGGLLDHEDIQRYVPEKVSTLFAISTNPAVPYVVSTTLASLSISEYGSATGMAGAQGYVFGDVAYTGANIAAVTAWAARAAFDWYGWRLSDIELACPGIEPWAPSGWEDTTEWLYQSRDGGPFAETVVRRGVWDDFVSGAWYAGLVPIPPNWFPGSGGGSGSGSGSPGCDDAIEPVTFDCDRGQRTATVKSIAVSVEDNKLVLAECDTEDFPLGPCSPNNPNGTTIPLTTRVCPVFTTINYLDWDSNPQSVRVITRLVSERTLVVVPIAGPIGCIEDDDGCCSGSGSGPSPGSGSGCTPDCDQCPTPGMADEWLVNPGTDAQVSLFHVDDPDDENYCRFSSLDLVWDLRYDYAHEVWVLTKNIGTAEETVWVIDVLDCHNTNTFTPASEDEFAIEVAPAIPCETVGTGWDCSQGTGDCVDGGTQYSTLAECQTRCGTVLTACCANEIKKVLNVAVSAVTGTCGCLPSSFELVYNPGTTFWESDPTLCGGVQAILKCDRGQFVLTVGADVFSHTIQQCNPFNLIFDFHLTNTCVGDATFTITEA